MTWWMVVLSSALAVSAACSKKNDSSACDARMDALAARLAPLADERPPSTTYSPVLEPLSSDKGSLPREAGVVLELTPDGGMRMDGRALTGAELAGRLEARATMGTAVSVAYLVFDRRTPRASAEKLVAGLPAGLEPRVVVMGAARGKTDRDRELEEKPSVDLLRKRLAMGDASERAVAIADAMSEAIAPCAPVAEVMGRLAAVPAADKGRIAAVEIPKAIRACTCELRDLDLVEYAVLAIFDAFGRQQRWLPLADGLALLPAS